MVWPFSSPSSKPSDYLDEDLAKYSQQAVEELNPNSQHQQQQTKPQLKRDVISNIKSLPQVAMDNCVEFEREYSNCLRSGNYSSRFMGCSSQQQQHDKCIELQTEALRMLGFASAATIDEKVQIKSKADDLMIQVIPGLSMSKEQVEEFESRLEQLKL